MRYSLCAITLLTTMITHAQTKHIVEASNNVFTPNVLTIDLGDTVEWRNVEGTHNVDGLQSTFTDNPVSFGNEVGTGWTYSFVFTVAGTYDYQCDLHASLGMNGQIEVKTVNTKVKYISGQAFKMFPNPATDVVTFEYPGLNKELKVQVFDLAGRLQSIHIKTIYHTLQMNVSQLPDGLYFVKLQDGNQSQIQKLIKN